MKNDNTSKTQKTKKTSLKKAKIINISNEDNSKIYNNKKIFICSIIFLLLIIVMQFIFIFTKGTKQIYTYKNNRKYDSNFKYEDYEKELITDKIKRDSDWLLAEHEARFINGIIRKNKPKNCLEIGVANEVHLF